MLSSDIRQQSVVLSLLLRVAKISVIAVSVVMVAVTLSQVIFRYVVEAPLPWSEELARYCFVWIVFLGGAIGLERGIHLGVDILVNRLRKKHQTALGIFTNVLIACFAISVVYASVPVIEINQFQRSPAMGVQMSWIYIAIPIGMSLIALISIERAVRMIFQRARREA